MKKKTVFLVVLVFALSITTVCLAAAVNQFSDVPAKHWAYDAVKKLAKDGIIEGDGDGTFHGQRTMTRYEMAQIVANAMTKLDKADVENKALINKLAAEYAAELNSLGTRVSVVEKNQGKITWSGDARLRWIRWDNLAGPAKDGVFQNNLTLYVKARVNEDVTGTVKIQALRHNDFGNPAAATASPDTNETNNILEANFVVKNFLGQDGLTATAGRFNQQFGATGFIMNLWGIDGAKVAFGKQLRIELGGADFSNPLSSYQNGATAVNTAPAADAFYGQLYFKDAYFVKMLYNTSKATSLQGFYLKNTSGLKVASVYGLGVQAPVIPNLVFRADYVKNDAFDGQNTNQQYRLLYRGLKVDQPKTWGFGIDYGKAYSRASFGWGDYNTTALYPKSGVQGWAAFYEQTLMKNVTTKIGQSFNSKNPATGADASTSGRGEWTRVEFNFFF